MTKVGSSLTHEMLSFSTPLDGPIFLFENQCLLHENLDAIPRIGDMWLFVDPPLLGGFAKFFKLKDRSKLQEGD
jgi:hypothetical protein